MLPRASKSADQTINGGTGFNEVFFSDVRVPDSRASAASARAGRSRSPR
jgi:hypothetical protein